MRGRLVGHGGLGAVFGLALVVGASSACQGPGATGGSDDLVGTAQIALTNVPADGTCVSVTATGYRTVTRTFGAAAGTSAVFEMGGLPLGSVTFTAAAFAGECPPAAGTVPTWVDDAPFTATIAIDPPALVTLNLVHNGNANVSIGFDDGADAGTASDGGGSGAGGSSGKSILMKVDGVTGPETAPAFLDWFDLEAFNFGSITALSSAGSGSGAGAGKTTWTMSATLRDQLGVPNIYSAAAVGKVLKTVEIDLLSGDTSSPVVCKITLTNVVVSSIQTNAGAGHDEIPDVTVTFVFARFEIEYDAPANADGIQTITRVTFDAATNRVTGATKPTLQFVVGGSTPATAEPVDAFRAPSEMTAGATVGTTGAGAGKATFGDASVSLPIDASVLGILVDEAEGLAVRTALVTLDTTGPAGPAVFGTYGFTNVRIDGVAFSNLEATVSFQAASFAWAVGANKTTTTTLKSF